MLWILALSLLIQVATAVLALRLVRVSKRGGAWICIALVSVLMAVRRTVTLVALVRAESPTGAIGAECVALVISALLLLGVLWLRANMLALNRQHRHRLDHIEGEVHAERQQLESQRLESLGLLAGGIAHDFNNLLTVILGNTSLARESTTDNETASELLDQIETASRRASDLAKQLLTYAGGATVKVQTWDLCEIVSSMQAMIRTSLPAGVKLNLHNSNEPLFLLADAVQIDQVLVNLVLNAAEAVDADRGGAVWVRTARCELLRDRLADCYPNDCKPGAYVVLTVADNGPGMSSAQLRHAFDPFYSTKGTGRGLGLSAVQGIVRSHGGAIAVECEPGEGTVFEIFLPLAPSPEPTTPEPAPARPTPRTDCGILVIDDDVNVRNFACRALESAGFRVQRADGGLVGLELCERDPSIDLVLVDRTMPGMTGDQFVNRLTEQFSDKLIVMMSGFTDPKDIDPEASQRIHEFLAKPFTASDVVAAIDRARTGSRWQ